MTHETPRTAIRASVPLFIPTLLILASAVSILATDLYTPSMPHLQDVFDTDAGWVQLTITLNLAAYALAQLIYGPLSDRIGRRPVLLGGMVGFAAASIGCALAGSIETFILARVLQGLTACAEAVVAYAVIRELYDQAGAVRVYAAYGMAVALAPAVGPVIGGYMHVWLGWRSNFILLTGLIILVTLLIWRYLPETLQKPDRGALLPRRLLRGYATLLGDSPFMTYTLIMALVLGGLGSDPLLAIGLALCALGGGSFSLLVAAGQETPLAVTVTQCFFGLGLGLVFATAPVRAFDVCRAGHGYAAAMLGALPMAGGGLATFCIALLHDDSAWPIALLLTVTTLSAAALYLTVQPWRAGSGSSFTPGGGSLRR
jgi:DHA1 family bicyclomycin/chloramphenicol resistance-like MFS transporter